MKQLNLYYLGGGGPSPIVPDGKTVLPTDDISKWLACGERTEPYTTLAQVLADATCRAALMANFNAVDYLVRSTTWASTVCNDDASTTDIGNNNYASNILTDDSTWLAEILSSVYVKKILNVYVPKMTSNSTPSGQCFSNFTNYPSEPAYYAFDENINTKTLSNGTASKRTDERIGYRFTAPKKIKAAQWRSNIDGALLPPAKLKIQGSSDGNVWTDLSETASPTADMNLHSVFVNHEAPYDYYSFYCEDRLSTNGYYYTQFSELQFYGREDV